MRRLTIAGAIAIILGLLAILGAGEALSHCATRVVGRAPADLHATDVQVPVSATDRLAGWFAPGKPGAGVVLLLHGVRGDRRQMIDRARFLEAAGYGVLLVDLQAHGESSGDRITFGVRESVGVSAALVYLRERSPGERVAVIGVSLGAASLVLAQPSAPPDAVVLESMYPTIEEAVGDRLAHVLGNPGRAAAPLLLWQFPLRLHVRVDQLHPIDRISALHAPLLLAAGTEDRHTTWAETERIFHAANEPKYLWPVPGAAHVDLHSWNPALYEARILAFLSQYLRDGVSGGSSSPAVQQARR